MTPEQQREALCKALNWEPPPPLSALCGWTHGDGTRMLSDPLNDLNAMHGAEKVLLERKTGDEWKWGQYCDELDKLASRRTHATAAQRAEAFLRTLNLWEES